MLLSLWWELPLVVPHLKAHWQWNQVWPWLRPHGSQPSDGIQAKHNVCPPSQWSSWVMADLCSIAGLTANPRCSMSRSIKKCKSKGAYMESHALVYFELFTSLLPQFIFVSVCTFTALMSHETTQLLLISSPSWVDRLTSQAYTYYTVPFFVRPMTHWHHSL